MRLVPFIADDTKAALAQIHAQLGDEAVVVSVRSVPAEGMARFLPGRNRVEVVAGINQDGLSEVQPPSPRSKTASAFGFLRGDTPVSNRWPSVAKLEQAGLAREHVDRLQGELERLYGASGPRDAVREAALVRSTLAHHWRSAPSLEDEHITRPHVFIGPPGSGKSTTLCKWLTRATLMEGRSAKAWRLDANTANTAEFLSLHCELLGVQLERFWSGTMEGADLLFVDLPGVESTDSTALATLCGQIATLGLARVHLVLNAAYDLSVLMSQWRAFAALEPEDVILTHLDESPSVMQLWNFVLGTNCCLRFVSGGQKIPGDFRPAAPEGFIPL